MGIDPKCGIIQSSYHVDAGCRIGKALPVLFLLIEDVLSLHSRLLLQYHNALIATLKELLKINTHIAIEFALIADTLFSRSFRYFHHKFSIISPFINSRVSKPERSKSIVQ